MRHTQAMADLEEIFHELRESEDERIRKWLYDYFNSIDEGSWLHERFCSRKEVLAWLEKQKEEEGYETIPVESTLEYKLGFKAGKESEKQKEQKPVAHENIFTSKPRSSAEILRHYLCWAENSEEDCPYTWKDLADAIMDGIKALEEQKPAEWSEEDEKMRQSIIHTCCCDDEQIAWLKSLRSAWKPSEEQPVEYPTSTEMIAEWENNELPMLREKDFRGDAERMAYNAFMDGFAKGLGYKK